jgi:Lrp/AsnC family leucine-responsive transcriptional regulator
MFSQAVLDEIDIKVIRRLMEQGRITWSELGAYLGMSAPAAADRVRRLEERGLIKGYAAIVDPEMLCGVTAFISVIVESTEKRDEFLAQVKKLTEVQECYHVAGNEDYLLKVRCRSLRELEHLVSAELKGVAGIIKTRTTVVMSTVKETSTLPLPGMEGAKS